MSGSKHKRPVAPRKSGSKPNHLLSQLEAKWEAENQICLQHQAEMDRIALMIATHDVLQVGPGRAGRLIDRYMEVKEEICKQSLDDCKDDPEVLVTKRDLASALKGIFGIHWAVYREYFGYLKQYWG